MSVSKHILAVLLLLVTNCGDKTAVGPAPVPPELKIDWVGSVEAGIRLQLGDLNRQAMFELRRDGVSVWRDSVGLGDTTFVDNDVQPVQSYAYRVFLFDSGETLDSSNVLTITTMDTTSHDFVWRIEEFGDFTSYFKDVSAISENDVWVVGKLSFNAIHWDGTLWKKEQIAIPSFDPNCNKVGNGGPGVLDAVFSFAPDDTWFKGGGTYTLGRYKIHKYLYPKGITHRLNPQTLGRIEFGLVRCRHKWHDTALRRQRLAAHGKRHDHRLVEHLGPEQQ